MYECYKDKTANNKDCNEEQVETFSAFVKELFGGVVDILCTDYVEGSDKCDKLGNFELYFLNAKELIVS